MAKLPDIKVTINTQKAAKDLADSIDSWVYKKVMQDLMAGSPMYKLLRKTLKPFVGFKSGHDEIKFEKGGFVHYEGPVLMGHDFGGLDAHTPLTRDKDGSLYVMGARHPVVGKGFREQWECPTHKDRHCHSGMAFVPWAQSKKYVYAKPSINCQRFVSCEGCGNTGLIRHIVEADSKRGVTKSVAVPCPECYEKALQYHSRLVPPGPRLGDMEGENVTLRCGHSIPRWKEFKQLGVGWYVRETFLAGGVSAGGDPNRPIRYILFEDGTILDEECPECAKVPPTETNIPGSEFGEDEGILMSPIRHDGREMPQDKVKAAIAENEKYLGPFQESHQFRGEQVLTHCNHRCYQSVVLETWASVSKKRKRQERFHYTPSPAHWENEVPPGRLRYRREDGRSYTDLPCGECESIFRTSKPKPELVHCDHAKVSTVVELVDGKRAYLTPGDDDVNGWVRYQWADSSSYVWVRCVSCRKEEKQPKAEEIVTGSFKVTSSGECRTCQGTKVNSIGHPCPRCSNLEEVISLYPVAPGPHATPCHHVKHAEVRYQDHILTLAEGIATINGYWPYFLSKEAGGGTLVWTRCPECRRAELPSHEKSVIHEYEADFDFRLERSKDDLPEERGGCVPCNGTGVTGPELANCGACDGSGDSPRTRSMLEHTTAVGLESLRNNPKVSMIAQATIDANRVLRMALHKEYLKRLTDRHPEIAGLTQAELRTGMTQGILKAVEKVRGRQNDANAEQPPINENLPRNYADLSYVKEQTLGVSGCANPENNGIYATAKTGRFSAGAPEPQIARVNEVEYLDLDLRKRLHRLSSRLTRDQRHLMNRELPKLAGVFNYSSLELRVLFLEAIKQDKEPCRASKVSALECPCGDCGDLRESGALDGILKESVESLSERLTEVRRVRTQSQDGRGSRPLSNPFHERLL